MGVNLSSSRATAHYGPLHPSMRRNLGSRCSSDLSSYTKDWEQDLFQKAVIPSDIENPSQCFEAFHQFLDWIDGISNGAVGFIFENKEGILRDNGFSSLVDLYFVSSTETLVFCNALESCFKQAKMNLLVFQYVIKQFKKDKEGAAHKALEELKRLKAAADPSGNNFPTLLASVHEQHVNLSNKLHTLKKKLVKEMKNVENSRMEKKVGEVGTAVVTKSVNVTMLTLSFQRLAAKVSELIERLESRMVAAPSIEDEEDSVAMDKITEDLEAFTEGIQKVGQRAENCYKDIMAARANIRDLIMKHPSN